MSRGGKRNGKVGTAYAQRSDLAGSPQAIKTAPGQAYGMAQQQRDSQAIVPVAGTAVPAPGAPSPGGQAAPAPQGPTPGMGFADPTARTGEPITAGMPMGAGPGPESLGLPDENGVEDLAMYLPMLEFMASQPGASAQTRNFVRRLRGAAPVK